MEHGNPIDAAELKRLLEGIRDPDRAIAARAAARLVELIGKPVLGMVRARAGQECADEISQDVMVKILVHKPRWDPRGQVAAFRNYLRKVVNSATGEHYRRLGDPRPMPRGEDFERCAQNRWQAGANIAGEGHPLPALPDKIVREALKELLRLTSAPHKLIVFVLNKLLDWKPSEILAEAARPLRELCAEAKQGCKELGLRAVVDAQWDDYFAELERTVAAAGDGGLSACSPGAEVAVGDWVRHIYLQFMTKVHDQEFDFLACVFAHDKAHEAIAYGLGDLLKIPVDGIWNRSGDPLRCLAAFLKTEYKERYDLAPARLEDCFRELEKKLRQFTLRAISDAARRNACLARNARRVGDTCLNDYYATGSRTRKLDELRAWQRSVRARVRKEIDRRGRGLLFAWVYGWLFDPAAGREGVSRGRGEGK